MYKNFAEQNSLRKAKSFVFTRNEGAQFKILNHSKLNIQSKSKILNSKLRYF